MKKQLYRLYPLFCAICVIILSLFYFGGHIGQPWLALLLIAFATLSILCLAISIQNRPRGHGKVTAYVFFDADKDPSKQFLDAHVSYLPWIKRTCPKCGAQVY